jgi:ABC-2 type transport system ATP-binding protein
VNDVTHEIGPGVTALLGMNGAGKSTLIKLITGQIMPTTGSVKVFGMEPFGNPEVYRKLGYCPEIDQFYEHWTGRNFVLHMARLAGLSSAEAKSRTDEVLHTVGMADRADKKLAGFSKGMRQRIKLAQAMVHDPSIILLDEPLNGLDPVGRKEFMSYLADFAGKGRTVLVSSHILFEVEQMTRSFMLLHRGRLLARGDVRQIRELIDKYPHRVRIETPSPRAVASKLITLDYVIKVEVDDRQHALEVQTRELNRFFAELPKLTVNDGWPITGFSSPDNNLESLFHYLVE